MLVSHRQAPPFQILLHHPQAQLRHHSLRLLKSVVLVRYLMKMRKRGGSSSSEKKVT